MLSRLIDTSWTLFLDRDGVINVNNDDGYVLDRSGFAFTDGALAAISYFYEICSRIIVVTNQRGVSKGLMTEDDLADIHRYMTGEIEAHGGRIDDIFYCTAMDDAHPDRKPNPGMAYKAKQKYPDIDFAKSIMVGDKLSDMEWGRHIGAFTVLITSPRRVIAAGDPRVDLRCSSLAEFARYLQNSGK